MEKIKNRARGIRSSQGLRKMIASHDGGDKHQYCQHLQLEALRGIGIVEGFGGILRIDLEAPITPAQLGAKVAPPRLRVLVEDHRIRHEDHAGAHRAQAVGKVHILVVGRGKVPSKPPDSTNTRA